MRHDTPEEHQNHIKVWLTEILMKHKTNPKTTCTGSPWHDGWDRIRNSIGMENLDAFIAELDTQNFFEDKTNNWTLNDKAVWIKNALEFEIVEPDPQEGQEIVYREKPTPKEYSIKHSIDAILDKGYVYIESQRYLCLLCGEEFLKESEASDHAKQRHDIPEETTQK